MDRLTKTQLLNQARQLIGHSYKAMDCSHFVQRAFDSAGMRYEYMNSHSFTASSNTKFRKVGVNISQERLQSGDVIVFNGHMGIWDPEGCSTLGTDRECVRLKNQAPFLSSRSKMGPEFGRLNWWTGDYSVYRWAD